MDPLAEEFPGWNPYHYVHNNPINLVDPTGMAGEWVPGTDGNAISYTVNAKGVAVWSSNTPTEYIKLGNAMLQTAKGKSQLDKALLSPDVKVDTFIHKGRKEGESGIFGKSTFGFATPLSVDDIDNPTKVTSGRIDLYPKAYEDILENEYGSFVKFNYGEETFFPSEFSVYENLSTTYGHEIEHLFDSNSSSHLNKLQGKVSDPEVQPNKVSQETFQQLKENKNNQK